MYSMVNIAQLTDLHLFAQQNEKFHGQNSWHTYNQVMALLKKNSYDAAIITGDISGDGSIESYANFMLGINNLTTPLYYVLGNHDNMSAFLQVTEVLPIICHDKCFVMGAWCFILLNSYCANCDQGVLSENEIAFLKQSMQNNRDKYIAIFLHHHPVPINSTFIDSNMLTNAKIFMGIVTTSHNVRLVVFGHIHQAFSARISNVDFLGTPATSLQFRPQQDLFEINMSATPAYREISLHPDGSFITRICNI